MKKYRAGLSEFCTVWLKPCVGKILTALFMRIFVFINSRNRFLLSTQYQLL